MATAAQFTEISKLLQTDPALVGPMILIDNQGGPADASQAFISDQADLLTNSNVDWVPNPNTFGTPGVDLAPQDGSTWVDPVEDSPAPYQQYYNPADISIPIYDS